MNRRQIIKEIYDILEKKYKISIKDKKSYSGYFILDVGEGFNNQFIIKKNKKWRFAFWITEKEESEEYLIDLFGQHSYFIDKFKPSCSPIKYSFKVNKSAEHIYDTHIDNRGESIIDVPLELYEFVNDIYRIEKSHFGSLIKYYWDGHKGILKWIYSTLFFYEIKYPILNFKKNQLTWLNLKIRQILISPFIKKWVNVSLIDNKGVWPRYIFKYVYDQTLSESATIKLYFLLDWLYRGVNYRVEHYLEGEKRSFYYKSVYLEKYAKLCNNIAYSNTKNIFVKLKWRIQKFIYKVKYHFEWM